MHLRKFMTRYGIFIVPLPWLFLASMNFWTALCGADAKGWLKGLSYLGIAFGFFLIQFQVGRNNKSLQDAPGRADREAIKKVIDEALKRRR